VANQLILGGNCDTGIVSSLKLNLDLDSQIEHESSISDHWPDWGITGNIAWYVAGKEVIYGDHDGVHWFDSETGEYKTSLCFFAEGWDYNWIYVLGIAVDEIDKILYVNMLKCPPSWTGRIYKIDLQTKLILSYTDLPSGTTCSGLVIVNNTYNSTPYHYLYLEGYSFKDIYKYSLPDLSYVSTIASPGQFQANSGRLYITEGYIYWAAYNRGTVSRLDVRTDTLIESSDIAYAYRSTLAIDQTTGDVFSTDNRYGGTPRLAKIDKNLNLIGYCTVDYWSYCDLAIDSDNRYIYFNNNNDGKIHKINIDTLVLNKTVELPYGYHAIVLTNDFSSPYPPADPIDDNPDTLPDPGGDPQEIVFRTETYKAIRSDESLLK
jgi:hypothetical protein